MKFSPSDFELNNAYVISLRGQKETFVGIVAGIEDYKIQFYKFNMTAGCSDLDEHPFDHIEMATKWFTEQKKKDDSRVSDLGSKQFQAMREKVHSQLDKLLDVAEMFLCEQVDVKMSFATTTPRAWNTLPTISIKKEPLPAIE